MCSVCSLVVCVSRDGESNHKHKHIGTSFLFLLHAVCQFLSIPFNELVTRLTVYQQEQFLQHSTEVSEYNFSSLTSHSSLLLPTSTTKPYFIMFQQPKGTSLYEDDSYPYVASLPKIISLLFPLSILTCPSLPPFPTNCFLNFNREYITH